MVRLLEEVDLRPHSCEISDTVEIDDAGGCLRENYVEEGTESGHSWQARGRCGLNERMVGVDDRRSC